MTAYGNVNTKRWARVRSIYCRNQQSPSKCLEQVVTAVYKQRNSTDCSPFQPGSPIVYWKCHWVEALECWWL